MIPSIQILTAEITESAYPSKTYKITFDVVQETIQAKDCAILGEAIIGEMVLGKNAFETIITEPTVNRINGYADDLESLKQAIYLILSTERYQYPIYSWDYGVELLDLIGKPMPYVISELPRRITEALVQDNRVDDVVDFEFKAKGKQLHVKFTVVSTIGNIPTELEVDI